MIIYVAAYSNFQPDVFIVHSGASIRTHSLILIVTHNRQLVFTVPFNKQPDFMCTQMLFFRTLPLFQGVLCVQLPVLLSSVLPQSAT